MSSALAKRWTYRGAIKPMAAVTAGGDQAVAIKVWTTAKSDAPPVTARSATVVSGYTRDREDIAAARRSSRQLRHRRGVIDSTPVAVLLGMACGNSSCDNRETDGRNVRATLYREMARANRLLHGSLENLRGVTFLGAEKPKPSAESTRMLSFRRILVIVQKYSPFRDNRSPSSSRKIFGILNTDVRPFSPDFSEC